MAAVRHGINMALDSHHHARHSDGWIYVPIKLNPKLCHSFEFDSVVGQRVNISLKAGW